MSATAVASEPFFRRPEVRFPVQFFALGALLAVLWSVLQPTSMWLRKTMANVVVLLSNGVGLHAASESSARVRFTDNDNVFRYVIDDGCTATLVMATYAVAVVAYPTDRRSRMLGLAAGLPILVVVNLIRLVTLGWFGLHVRASFDVIHLYWWQVFFVAGTGLLWFAWAWRTSDARTIFATTRVAVRSPTGMRTAFVVIGQLLAFAFLGLWGHGADIYFRVTSLPLRLFGHILWGGELGVPSPNPDTALLTYTGSYAFLAAVVALFLATPGVHLRQRLRGVVRWGVPIVALLQLVSALWMTTVQIRAASEGPSGVWGRTAGAVEILIYVTHIGVALFAWQWWLRRIERAEERRLQRAASSRRPRKRTRSR